jgi:hypothetical protein
VRLRDGKRCPKDHAASGEAELKLLLVLYNNYDK